MHKFVRKWLVPLGLVASAFAAVGFLRPEQDSGAHQFSSITTTPYTWPLCRVTNSERSRSLVRLVVDEVGYNVEPRKIFLMSRCQEGHVEWFTLFRVTDYRALLTIKSRSTIGNLSRAREFATAHAEDPLTPEGLLRDPTFDDKRWSNYLARSEGGLIVAFGCNTPERYCKVNTELEGGTKVEYTFDLQFLSDWRSIDNTVRSYIDQLKEVRGTD